MIIDLPAFTARAKRLAKAQGWSHKALSKRLFKNTHVLPILLGEEEAKVKADGRPSGPGIFTMQRAEQELSKLEAEAKADAA